MKQHWPWFLLIALALALALLLRYDFIEPSSIGLQCTDPLPPWWCVPREALVLVHVWNGWALSALLLLLAFVRYRHAGLLALAFVAACLGMILYNTGLASLAFLAGLYLLGRRLKRRAA